MNNKDAPLESVLTLAILTGLLSRIEDGVAASVSHRDLCLVPFAMPSPAIIFFLSDCSVFYTFSKSCHLSESSEGRQPSARTAYDDGSAQHLGGLIHPDLLLAGSPSRAGGGILSLSQVVATPLLIRPVLVWCSTTTPQIWTTVGRT